MGRKRDEAPPVIHCEACGKADELQVACAACGSLVGTPAELIEQANATITALQHQLTSKLVTIRKLQADQRNALRQSPHYDTAIRVLEKWRDMCHPGAKELESGERLKNVIARLNGKYTEEELTQCIIGYSRFPYVVNGRRVTQGTPGNRRIDAELIFRDPGHVDQGIAFFLEAQRRDQAIPRMAQQPPPLPTTETSQLSNLGRSALRLAQLGFYVFPVAPRGKHPVTINGLKDASIEEPKIVQFWLKHPEHNIGLRCGIESGVIVLDVDGDVGLESLRALEAKYESLPLTASIVTPRGGQHYYFAHPGAGEIRNTTSFPGPGLDIRGDGGYVLAPPSIGANGKIYEVDEQAKLAPIPNWLVTILINRQKDLPVFRRDYREMVHKGVREGQRNSELTSLVGHLIAKGHPPDEAFEITHAVNEARCSPPLDRREVRRIVESVVRMEQRKAQQTLKGLVAA